ncbi:MAG: AAA domain-containing protein [Candidatus Sericytochromatia bacterium]|nr:AAA domain-containing protein [Candidatus Sericytochromatia bacterium]
MTDSTNFLKDLKRAVEQERAAQSKRKTAQWITIDKVELVTPTPGSLVYRLTLVEVVKFPIGTGLKFRVSNEVKPVQVDVLSCEDNNLMVASKVELSKLSAGPLRIEFDATHILKKLEEHLDQVLRRPPPPLAAVLGGNPLQRGETQLPPAPESGLNAPQASAFRNLVGQQVHLLWGPPGTGKTHTLGTVIAEHLGQGRSCLLLSNSNVAVDELVKATRRAMGPAQALAQVFRVGVSLSEEVEAHTASGYVERRHPEDAKAWREDQQALADLNRRMGRSRSELADSDIKTLDRFREQQARMTNLAEGLEDDQVLNAPCVAATLAALVVRETLATREFDVVVIDEASMVSLAFAFAGAAQATQHLIYAGDFLQLPPVCVSDEPDAQRWFGRNIFDHFEVKPKLQAGSLPPFVSMLTDQYRMTEAIGSIVSDLSYESRLVTAAVRPAGTKPKLLDVGSLCPTSWYSTRYQSYYHPYTPWLLACLKERHPDWLGPTNLLLTPFKAQSTLLVSLTRDLSEPHMRFEASTIHKSQGAQQDTVVVDLTAHDATKAQQFFTGDSAENLLNVAMSRAQQRLVIVGNMDLIRRLAPTSAYWRRFLDLIQERFEVVSAWKVIEDHTARLGDVTRAIEAANGLNEVVLPALFIAREPQLAFSPEVAAYYGGLKASTKLAILPTEPRAGLQGGVTYRKDERGAIRPFAMAKGILALPIGKPTGGIGWATARMPGASKQLFSVACGHLFDDTFKPEHTMRLACPKCRGVMSLSFDFGTPFLGCECGYKRAMGEADAKVLVESTPTMRCPECGSKPQPRRRFSDKTIFLGCSNYPACKGIVDLRPYDDKRMGSGRLR